MSEIDFQNGLVAGLMIAGKNGAIGGVAPSAVVSPPFEPWPVFNDFSAASLLPYTKIETDIDYPEE